MDVSATTWQTLSSLLDEALDMQPMMRAAWLEQIAATRPELAPTLRKLLSAHATEETADLLARPPALPSLAATSDTDTHRGEQLAADTNVGPYRLRKELGSGGMADVWLADRVDGTLARTVALKIPRLGALRRDLALRFARERDILARLEHPHIARLYDAGISADGLPYLAMEYVDGRPITERCDALRLDVDSRLRLFAQVLDAVQYAHANLVIHRDLKPSNILVTADGQVRLLDFGIAKLLADDETARETHLTRISGRALTPDYASPEQVLGKPLSIATDLYSLGVVLYELLAGKRPYQLKVPSIAQLEEAIVGTDPARPSTVVDEGPAPARRTTANRLSRTLAGDLDTIVMKALAKTPGARYATVAEFAEDLQRYREGQPIRAQPAALGYRVRKFLARNKIAVSAAAGVFLALVVATVLVGWQAREAHRAAAKADAVKDFLTTLFEANSLEPSDAARRRSVTAAQLLDEGAARIGTHFQDQPELKLELQGLIGRLMHDLALSDQALALRKERVALLGRVDASAPERARALHDLADTLAQKGDYDGARAQLRAAIDLLDAKGTRTSEVLRWSLVSALGYLDMDTDRAGAERKLQEGADQLHRLAPQSIEYAEALLHLGEAHSLANRTELSVRMFDAALQLLERALGSRSVRLAQYRYQVAEALADQRRWHESEMQVRAALQTLRDVAGPDHPSTAVAELSLARTLSMQGQPEQARALLEPAVAALKARPGLDPQHLANALLFIGETYLDEGRVADAGPPLEEALPRLEADASASPLSVARTLYARYLLDAGRYAEAEAQLVSARAQRIALSGADHPSVAALTNRLGLVFLAAGRLAEAEATFQSVLVSQPNREEVFGSPRHLATFNLATLDLERQRYAEALPVFRRFLQSYEALPEGDRNRISELTLCLRLARALIGTGRIDEAAAFVERAEPLAASLYEHAPLRFQLHLMKARLLAARGEAAQARAEIALARASLVAQPVLGPHFERQLLAAERDVAGRGTIDPSVR